MIEKFYNDFFDKFLLRPLITVGVFLGIYVAFQIIS